MQTDLLRHLSADARLREELAAQAAALHANYRPRPEWVYASPLAFLLEHGHAYPVAPRPAWLPLGQPKCCFANALFLAEWYGLQYVEGYALLSLNNEPALALLHAWVSDATGAAYEVTTPAPWLAYFGMPFSIERADDATWNGDSCVLDDFKRHHPLICQHWAGEQPLQDYTPSPHLRRLRQRKRQGLPLFSAARFREDN